MNTLAQGTSRSAEEIFGKITPPPGPSILFGDPLVGLGTFFAVLLNVVFVTFGLLMLTYLIWGAWDWVTSEGDEEKLKKARAKITDAIMGLFIFIVSLVIFSVIAGNILGVIVKTPQGWRFNVPVIK